MLTNGVGESSGTQSSTPLPLTRRASDSALLEAKAKLTSFVIGSEVGEGAAAPKTSIIIVPSSLPAETQDDELIKFITTSKFDAANLGHGLFRDVSDEDLVERSKHDVNYQYMLDELLYSEEAFLENILVTKYVYRHRLLLCPPKLISPDSIQVLATDVWGWTDSFISCIATIYFSLCLEGKRYIAHGSIHFRTFYFTGFRKQSPCI